MNKFFIITNSILSIAVIALLVLVLYLHGVQDKKLREIEYKIDTHIYGTSEIIK
jgi:type IV secretory pathway VirB3-like protein